MKALVIYDSNFGNTKLLAEKITAAIDPQTPTVAVTEVNADQLVGLELLVVGSPINGWRPTEKMGRFLATLKPGQLRGCRVATFDTRIKIFFHGEAASTISKNLVRAGATLAAKPEPFYVMGMKGPLKVGELERGQAWARTLITEQT